MEQGGALFIRHVHPRSSGRCPAQRHQRENVQRRICAWSAQRKPPLTRWQQEAVMQDMHERNARGVWPASEPESRSGAAGRRVKRRMERGRQTRSHRLLAARPEHHEYHERLQSSHITCAARRSTGNASESTKHAQVSCLRRPADTHIAAARYMLRCPANFPGGNCSEKKTQKQRRTTMVAGSTMRRS